MILINQCSTSVPPENIKKPKVFWCFHGHRSGTWVGKGLLNHLFDKIRVVWEDFFHSLKVFIWRWYISSAKNYIELISCRLINNTASGCAGFLGPLFNLLFQESCSAMIILQPVMLARCWLYILQNVGYQQPVIRAFIFMNQPITLLAI